MKILSGLRIKVNSLCDLYPKPLFVIENERENGLLIVVFTVTGLRWLGERVER